MREIFNSIFVLSYDIDNISHTPFFVQPHEYTGRKADDKAAEKYFIRRK